MKHTGMCALALACAFSAQAEVLQWRDAQGRVQFGDRPPAGAAVQPVMIDDAARLTPAGSDDTLAKTLRYARQRDRERMAEMAPARKPAKKRTAAAKSKKLKWRPGMAW